MAPRIMKVTRVTRLRQITKLGRLGWLALLLVALSLGNPGLGWAAERGHEKNEEQQWLGALVDRVIADTAAGRPMVVQVHAPLCEQSIIPCGNARLGDGESLRTNLYWATTAGFGRWFGRSGGGWKRVLEWREGETGDPEVLSVMVYRRTIATAAAWRKRGAPKSFTLYVVIHGWRGTAIDRALKAYARELAGLDERLVQLGAATTTARAATAATTSELELVRAGGGAHLVAYSGHNRLMDYPAAYAWPAPGSRPIGAIAVACHTASYMATQVSSAMRVPLLMTRDFLFANAAPVEGVILAFARGGGYAELRRAAAEAYAGVQKKETRRVFGAFTNPADRRWSKAK